jgi:hypothetical protein
MRTTSVVEWLALADQAGFSLRVRTSIEFSLAPAAMMLLVL